MSRRISNGALSSEKLPTRLKVLDWGDSPSLNGLVKVNAHSAVNLPVWQERKGWDRIAIDFEHNTLEGTPEFTHSQEPRHVAAFGVAAIVPGDGVYLDDIEWTPTGHQYAADYYDLSPAPLQTRDGTVIGVHSVALCRHGAVPGVHFYTADVSDGVDAKITFHSVTSNQGEEQMDWKKWLTGFVGAKEDATDADIEQGFTAKITALCAEAVKPVSEALDALRATVGAISIPADQAPTITALSAEVAGLKTSVATYQTEIEKRDRADILAGAAREGKVVALSAEAIEKLSIDQLREHVKDIPVTVPLEQRTPDRIVPHSADAVDSDMLAKIARNCGVDPAAVK